jgi:hypothetical protein
MKKLLTHCLIGLLSISGTSLWARTWRVDDDKKQNSHADFTTLVEAVNAATDGDRIVVYAGTYDAAITIVKSLKIVGPKQGKDGRSRDVKEKQEAILTATAGQHLLLAADGIELDGFLIRIPTQNFPLDGRMGLLLDGQFSGYQINNNVFDYSGVEANSSGALRTLLARNGFVNDGRFHGIFATGGHNVTLEKNSFQDAPVWFLGSTLVVVRENRFRGVALQDETQTIHLRLCTNVLVTLNKFSALATLGLTQLTDTIVSSNTFNTGGIRITLEHDDITVQYNRLSHCARGIMLANEGPGPTQVYVWRNEIEDGGIGIFISGDAYYNAIDENNVEDNQVGIEVGAPAEAFIGPNAIRWNEVRGNKLFDCLDHTVGPFTSGTANGWEGNEGSKSSPPGLCHD